MKFTGGSILVVYLGLARSLGAEQFVDVTAEISSIWWLSTKAVSQVSTVQCVVGLTSWQIREQPPGLAGSTYTNWFTGTNFIEHSRLFTVNTFPDGPPPWWSERTQIVPSIDGNPSRPRNLEDIMGEEGRAVWLAFCSGPFLKKDRREIRPTAFSWKFETWPAFLPDRTVAFKDSFGLPERVDIATTNGQPVFVYRVSASTNFLGWNLPLEFHIVQYRPERSLPLETPYYNTNSWVVDWTATGKITSLRIGVRPAIPPALPSSP
jgi:hypothetical protein